MAAGRLRPRSIFDFLDHIVREHVGCEDRLCGSGMTLAGASSINVAAGVVGGVIWPVWFGMDFKDAAGKEALPEALAAIAAEGIDHVFASRMDRLGANRN